MVAERIEARYRRQMAAGFLDEVGASSTDPRGMSRTARQALGYKELLATSTDAVPLDEALDLAVRRTRRFARRQAAWFRRDPRITWLDATATRPACWARSRRRSRRSTAPRCGETGPHTGRRQAD